MCHTTLAQVVLESVIFTPCRTCVVILDSLRLPFYFYLYFPVLFRFSFLMHTDLDNLDSVENNLRHSAKGSLDAYDVTFSLTQRETLKILAALLQQRNTCAWCWRWSVSWRPPSRHGGHLSSWQNIPHQWAFQQLWKKQGVELHQQCIHNCRRNCRRCWHTLSCFRISSWTRLCIVKLLKILVALFQQRGIHNACWRLSVSWRQLATSFEDTMANYHPPGIAEEVVACSSSNTQWAFPTALEGIRCRPHRRDLTSMFMTIGDADTLCHLQLFRPVTFQFAFVRSPACIPHQCAFRQLWKK